MAVLLLNSVIYVSLLLCLCILILCLRICIVMFMYSYFMFMYLYCYVCVVLCFVLVHSGDRGSTVVKVLCYKTEGRWFDPSWCQWNFSLT